jgi:hypothetical protein
MNKNIPRCFILKHEICNIEGITKCTRQDSSMASAECLSCAICLWIGKQEKNEQPICLKCPALRHAWIHGAEESGKK